MNKIYLQIIKKIDLNMHWIIESFRLQSFGARKDPIWSTIDFIWGYRKKSYPIN